MDAILLNCGVKAFSVPVPYGDPWVTSCTTHLSILRDRRMAQNPPEGYSFTTF